MERKEFLKGIGLASAASIIPFKSVFADAAKNSKTTAACVLIPTETAGPFPLDLTTNTTFSGQIYERQNQEFGSMLK